jgi:cation-transporting ATPase E
VVDEKLTGGASKGTAPLAPAMSGKPPGEVGLSAEEVRQRVIAGQVNAPPPSPGRTIGQIVRANVLTRFNAILGSLFVVVAIVGPIQDGLFGVVVLANTTIGIIQELRAKWTLDRLAILTAPRAHALRGGSSAEPVVSDIAVEDVVGGCRG